MLTNILFTSKEETYWQTQFELDTALHKGGASFNAHSSIALPATKMEYVPLAD